MSRLVEIRCIGSGENIKMCRTGDIPGISGLEKRGVGGKNVEKKKKKEKKKYASIWGYEDTAQEPGVYDHHFLLLTLEHWCRLFVQSTRSSQESIRISITPVVRTPESLGLTWMLQRPATSAGTLLSKQTFSSYLTSLFDRFLMREKVSIENPWFLKTWLERSVTGSFSYWGGMQIGRSLCPSNSRHNTRRLSPWKLIAYLPGGRRRKAGFRVSNVRGIWGVSSRR